MVRNFEKLAKRFSKAFTSKDGGKIGFVSLDSLPDGLKKILKKLKEWENSNLLFHLTVL